MPPFIGITADYKKENVAGNRPKEIFFCKSALVDAVVGGGGSPAIIPYCPDYKSARDMVKRIDGLLISGGDFDIDPALYGERRNKKVVNVIKDRTLSEFHLLKAALSLKKPVLGICGGHQLINVYFGGTLYQDIPSQLKNSLKHVQKPSPLKPAHKVEIGKGTRLCRVIGKNPLDVNSTHHQSIKKAGKSLAISAVAPDGVIEAIESTGKQYLIGVQWHPEYLLKRKRQVKIFESFIAAASRR